MTTSRLDPAPLTRSVVEAALAVADTDGHSMLVSCGAALHLTELALRAQGRSIETVVLSDVEAALRRRSDRRPFAAEQIPDDVVDDLQARGGSRRLPRALLGAGGPAEDLAVAVSWADRVERDDQAYVDEMNGGLRDPEVRAFVDGVPVEAIPQVPASAPRHTDVPLRDFEAGITGKLLIERDVDEKPLIAVVLTDFDIAHDHLQGGRSMMRLMIAAELRCLATCPLSQAVDFRRFMLFFGPISSPFDFLTFGVMLGKFHAGPALFRTGWYVESLATQTLVIFAVRTRRVPFFRSRASVPLVASALTIVAVGAAIPFTPLAGPLGFTALPATFFAALAGMVVAYLVLIEFGKRVFYAETDRLTPHVRRRGRLHRIERRAARFGRAVPQGTD